MLYQPNSLDDHSPVARSKRWYQWPPTRQGRRVIQTVMFCSVTIWLMTGGGKRVIRWLDVGAANPELTTALEGPAIDASGLQKIVLSEKGRKVLEFQAERSVLSADRVFYTIQNVTQGIIYRDGQPYLQLKAEKVRLNQQTLDWEADGALQASGPDGFSVQTRRASWDQQRDQLSCPGQVKGQVRGMGFETRQILYEVKQGQLKCPQNVRLVGPHGSFEGKNGLIDTKSGRVEFTGASQIKVRPSVTANPKLLPSFGRR